MDPKAILDFICRRRSVRRFAKKDIPEETLEILMKAAMAAPSGNNVQPWEFVIVRDPKTKEALSRVHPWVYMAAEAPAAIVVLGDKSSEWWRDDCAAATENILLAAANLGLGAVWCGINEGHAPAVRKILGIPSRLEVLCIIPIGYAAESPPPHTKYRKDKVHSDTYGQKF
ncbi:MAG: nitroreductase family protein [Thermodesulfobacteriota bacterium]|nr:nitroreductase family protein [Thermodesulfobacteriota bacterium]